MFNNFVAFGALGIRIGKKQPMYLNFYRAGRGNKQELLVHREIEGKPFLNTWYWGFWIPRIRINLCKKYLNKFSLKWLIFGFNIDKH